MQFNVSSDSVPDGRAVAAPHLTGLINDLLKMTTGARGEYPAFYFHGLRSSLPPSPPPLPSQFANPHTTYF